ncbi:MAG TPA: hypothetical protein VFV96_08390 [Verrucomicrobiae bacterium]|nr:hypothetical protein [Verrucomicrobiae bacterium]
MNYRTLSIFRVALMVASLSAAGRTLASENVPHAPFAQWADLPARGEFRAGVFYEESEAYHIWADNTYHDVTWHKNGETYGIDINQGYVALQYGLTEKWAADLSIGYTTAAWRDFANGGNTHGTAKSTTGFMDVGLGVRYQFWNETNAPCAWCPTLTFRAGAVLPGGYNKDFPFAPGDRSAAIEPELLAKKHFGWTGFGMYADALFRWNRTTHNDHYIVSTGFLQEIRDWELNVGYRRLGTVSGDSIQFDPTTRIISYPREVREINDSLEAGFRYTTPHKHIEWGFYLRDVLDGANTDGKFWVGGYVNVPFHFGHAK